MTACTQQSDAFPETTDSPLEFNLFVNTVEGELWVSSMGVQVCSSDKSLSIDLDVKLWFELDDGRKSTIKTGICSTFLICLFVFSPATHIHLLQGSLHIQFGIRQRGVWNLFWRIRSKSEVGFSWQSDQVQIYKYDVLGFSITFHCELKSGTYSFPLDKLWSAHEEGIGHDTTIRVGEKEFKVGFLRLAVVHTSV